MRVRTWIVSFLAAAAIGPAGLLADSRRVELSCVNKSGENMYRASDGSVVWTANCGHDSRCADAIVTVGNTPNSGVIRWIGGGSCHVVNAALSRGSSQSDRPGRAKKPRRRGGR